VVAAVVEWEWSHMSNAELELDHWWASPGAAAALAKGGKAFWGQGSRSSSFSTVPHLNLDLGWF
jgi:hypothetical protein